MKRLIFSDFSIRAIIDGRKNQTRRVVTAQNSVIEGRRGIRKLWPYLDLARAKIASEGPKEPGQRPILEVPLCLPDADMEIVRVRPRWKAGDMIAAIEAARMAEIDGYYGFLRYRADNSLRRFDFIEDPEEMKPYRFDRWTPSIHMPDECRRITLELTRIRVERLLTISVEDCIAEGISEHISGMNVVYEFRHLWESLHGKNPEKCWDANPWVWVFSFEHTLRQSNRMFNLGDIKE